MKQLLYLLILISTISCAQQQKKASTQTPILATPQQTPTTPEGYKTAYFASGCFWCSESIYESVIGVIKVVPGYSGGTGKNPTYQNYMRTGHAETVAVTYDPHVVDFSTLLTVYFGSQNVTQQYGQGPDEGSGYRSIIFYQNAKEKQLIEAKIKAVQQQYSKPVAAEVLPFQKFWEAEDYHHDYEKRHLSNPYIQQVSIPRLERFQAKHPELIKSKEKP